MIYFLVGLIIYWIIELVYFRIANRFDIIDKPNSRSSHSKIAIRGGGIIFPIAFLIPQLVVVYEGWLYISLALFAIGLVSLLDDIQSLNNWVRLAVQSISVIILLSEYSGSLNPVILILSFILITGVINAYNFMDGINGITALYSIVTIGTLFWASLSIKTILPPVYFLSLLSALVVFSYFNIRKTASCFAGDVGSVSLAFIISFLIVRLSVDLASWTWVLILGIYGLDSVVTIFLRLIRHEPVFKAHRSHFYQYLANERRMSYLHVSLIYAFAQLLLNGAIFAAYWLNRPMIAYGTLFCFLFIYIIFRLRFEGRRRLFIAY